MDFGVARRRGGGWRAVRRLAALALLATLAPSSPCCASHWARGTYANQPLPPSVRIDRLVVHKSDQRMDVFRGTELLKSYRVQTGFARGAKRWEGDKRTPEGEYRVDARYPSKRFHRFLLVSYPNASDNARYQELKREGVVPAGAGVGSAIGIHGQSDTAVGKLAATLGINWTAGCVALTDAEITELHRAVAPQARLAIVP